MRYHGHKQEVRLLLPLGDQLISADSGGDVVVWSIKGGGEQEEAGLQSHSPVLVSITVCSLPPTDIYLRLNFDPGTFDVSAMMHPSTYLNKVLLGSSQGALQLWNIKTSPAVDVVGVGTVTGRIIIHNIRIDETLMSFTQDWGPISTLAFRTDGPPIVASGSPQGHIAFWDLESRQLVAQQRHAHRTAVAAATKKKEKKKKKGLSYEELRLPAITALASGITRQSDWDGIVACHRGRLTATTWSYQRCTMGAHHLKPPFAGKDAVATAVDITSCGNFAVIGSSCGHVDIYNLQSGLHRGCYGDGEKGELACPFDCSTLCLCLLNLVPCAAAHSGVVRGVATDSLNQLTLSCGSDWLLKFWRFKTRKQEEMLKLGAAPALMRLHRDSPDGRWLVTTAMDCTIRTWDLPSGRSVPCCSGYITKVSVPVLYQPITTQLSFLRNNRSLCGPVGLRPLPADYHPVEETLPGVTEEDTAQEVTSEETDDAYQSAEQLGVELVTLSLMPESRWKSLLHLDAIKVSSVMAAVVIRKV
ncbi:hypothetical protein GOODEAATRI_027966 [Goodea atripinnis]|uniref:WDR36/Utp21 C-terminal domain-containing protein n=1 Tax=Goodea atripinnis TaxID=208336 RepID=A0ABV0NNU7_9TELE